VIDAFVYHRDGEFNVLLTSDGVDYDHAGPFDDEYDAVMAACRSADSVHVPEWHAKMGVR
jgi:hypothetical protein